MEAAEALPPAVAPKPEVMMTSREHQPHDTVIEVGAVRIGGGGFMVIAGPCSVESSDQMLCTAQG